jgi:hypothetical protein
VTRMDEALQGAHDVQKVLVTGPSGCGKTRRTADLLAEWLQRQGPQGVVVVEFAPEHDLGDGRVLGRRLERYLEIPDEVLYLMVETKAPRAGAAGEEQAVEVAQANQEAAEEVWRRMPSGPKALFVNDATMAFHVPGSDPASLLQAIEASGVAVVNALDPQGFEADHPITLQELRVLERIGHVVDRVERFARPVREVSEEPAP